MADITGKYDLKSSDNFDKYMEAIGVSFLLRKVANGVTNAQLEITKEGEEYTMKSISKIKTTETKFQLDKEFKETTMDGRDVMSTFSLNGNILHQVQKGIKDPEFVSTIDREITPQGLTATIKYKDVTAVRKYDRL